MDSSSRSRYRVTGATETAFAVYLGPVAAVDAVANLVLQRYVSREKAATIAGHLTFGIHAAVALAEGNEPYKAEIVQNLLRGEGPLIHVMEAQLGRIRYVLPSVDETTPETRSATWTTVPTVNTWFSPVIIHRTDLR
jgi:hypothetical protein